MGTCLCKSGFVWHGTDLVLEAGTDPSRPLALCRSHPWAPLKVLLGCWPVPLAAGGTQPGCLSPSRWLLLLGRGCFQGMWVQIAPWGFALGCASVSLFCCLRKPLCSFPSEPVRVGAMLGCVLPARRGRRLQSCSFPVPF